MDALAPNSQDHLQIERIAKLAKQRPVWLRVGKLIDGDLAHPIQNAEIVFDAQKIIFVGNQPPANLLSPSQGEPDLVLSEHTLLPTLIEAHAHLFLDGAPIDFEQRKQYLKQTDQWMLDRACSRWPAILSTGVGTVRDAGDNRGVGLALAKEAKKSLGGLASTPYIDSPGSAIHHHGRYGSFMGEPIEDYNDAEHCVAARITAGADRIKLLVSGIINFKAGKVTAPPQMDIAGVSAIVSAAQQHNRQTFAHASGSDGVENAIEGGVTTVEHGFFVTEDQLDRMRDRDIAWVPTFAPVQLQIDAAAEMGWDDQVVDNLRRIIESHQQMLYLGHQKGVKILAGSDAGSCGVPHGIGLLTELFHMQQAGLPPMSVIQTATSISACTLEFAERIGRLAPGYRSRMILTKHDPTQTVANLQKEKIILFDGTAISSDGSHDTQGL